MRGVKSYRDKTKVSKVVAGKKPSISISDSGTNTILKTSTSQNPNRASRSAPDRARKHRLLHVRIIFLNVSQLLS
jgi:hypothetical protein